MTDVRLTATNPEDSSVVPVACNSKGELKLEEIPSFNGNLQGDLTVSGSGTFAGGVQNAYNYIKTDSTNPNGWVARADTGIGTVFSLYANGAASFAGDVVVNGTVKSNTYDSGVGYSLYRGDDWGGIYFKAVSSSGLSSDAAYPLRASFDGAENVVIRSSGKAYFAGDVVVGSRGSKWKIVESGGIAHLIQETALMADEASDDPAPGDQDIEGGSEPVYPELRNLPRELDLIEQALAEVLEKLRMTPPAGFPVWDGSDENS